MSLDIAGYLEGKGVTLRRASDKEVHTHCFFHGEEQDKRGRLYINVDPSVEPPGLFHCKVCDERGWAKQILEYFGDTLKQDEETEKSESLHHIYNAATDYYHEKLLENKNALVYLTEKRGLTVETIEKHKLGWADGTLKGHLNRLGIDSDDILKTGLIRDSGQDFLIDRITIPYIISGNTVTIRGKDMEGKYFGLPGAKARLFNSDSAWHAETILITEGEFDALVAEQLGYAAVGVPGANSWQEGWKGYLSGAHRLFVVFDADKPGDEAADKLLSKLDRARKVRLPIDGADISDWVVKHGATKQEFDKLISSVKSKILVTVGQAYEEWEEYMGEAAGGGLKLNISELDNRFTHGILPGQIIVVQASTGAGKTNTVIDWFYRMAKLQPDKKFLYVSLEQTRADWFDRAWKMFRFYEHIKDPKEAQRKCVEFWDDRLILIDRNRVQPEELEAAIAEHELEYGMPDMIAVDYLGYWARAFKGDQYHATSAAVFRLKQFAKDWRVPILVPHQVNRSSKAGEEPDLKSSRDSGAVEETADFMFSLWSPDQKPEREGENLDISKMTNEVNLRVVKARNYGKGQKVTFQFAAYSLALPPKSDTQFYLKAKKELPWYLKGGGDYEKEIQRHFAQAKAQEKALVIEDDGQG